MDLLDPLAMLAAGVCQPTLLGPDLCTIDCPIRLTNESIAHLAVCVGLSRGPMLTAGEICASSSSTALPTKTSTMLDICRSCVLLLFPSPLDIIAKGSARSSSNACNWGVSATLLGADLRTTDSPSRLTIESPACPTVYVGIFGGSAVTAKEICASSFITILLIPFPKCPMC